MTDQLTAEVREMEYWSVAFLLKENQTFRRFFHSVCLVEREQRMKRKSLLCFLLRIE